MTTKARDDDAKRELLGEIAVIRDTARVRMHLLSMEARERWAEFETRIDGIERALSNGTEKLANGAGRVLELRRAVGDFLSAFGYAPDYSARVSTVMSSTVRSVSAHDTLAQVARELWDGDVGALPVLAEDGSVVGMITDRDVCMSAYTRGQTLHELPVSAAMSRGLHRCAPDDTLDAALELMAEHQIRRLPVVSREGRLLGIVTLADIAAYAAGLPESKAASVALVRFLAAIGERRSEVSTRSRAA